MAEYLHDPRTGQVYEKVARSGDFVWVRRMEDGVLDTLPRRQLEPYEPSPKVGEVWLDGEQEVVIVGSTAVMALGVEVPVDPDAEVVEVGFYMPGEITPKPKEARPRGGETRPAIDPEPEPEPPAEPEPDTVAEARAERQA